MIFLGRPSSYLPLFPHKQDLNAHEDRVAEVNTEANTLLEEQHPEKEQISDKQNELNLAWENLKLMAANRQEKLFGAMEIQRFNR